MIKDEKTYILTYDQIFDKLYKIYKPQESYVSLKNLVSYIFTHIDKHLL